MATRGRKRTPTRILKLQDSSALRKRNRRNVEPTPEPGAPIRPSWLDAEAKRCWARTVKGLKDMGILSKTDASVLASYCHNWSIWVRTAKMLNKATDWTARETLSVFKASQAACREFSRAAEQFGLTPAARARLDVSTEKGRADEFDIFVSSKKGPA